MTLLLGWKCSNGVLIAADRKIIAGGEASYADKIFQQAGLVMAFEGLTGLRDDFLILLEAEFKRVGQLGDLYNAKIILEDIVSELSKRYADRLGEEEGTIGVLLGGLSAGTRSKARLYYVRGMGYGEQLPYLCTGHGGEYAHTLAKFLHAPSLGVEENALRAAFVVAYVAEDVDILVGGKPQVAMVRNGRQKVAYAPDSLIEQACDLAAKAKKSLPSMLGIVSNP